MHHAEDKEAATLSEVETLYMQTSFEEIDLFINTADSASGNEQFCSRLCVNQKLREALEHDLLVLSEQLSSFSLEVS